MHQLIKEYKTRIVEFREWLDTTHLAELLDLYRRYGEQQKETTIRRDLAFAPDDLAVLARHFVLGEELPTNQLDTWIPRRFRENLDTIGFDFSRHRLIRHLDLWVLCERQNPSVELYHGDDSVGLSRLILPSRGRCLDLCAGVGTQGLLCARTAKSVVAVEWQKQTDVFFWFNAVLNGVDNKMEFRQGDFVDEVDGDQFDHVICNPPLLPMPADLDYPLIGDGGPDGMLFIRRLLEALPELLNPGGQCHIIGTRFGGPLGPDTSEWEQYAKKGGLDIFAIMPFRGTLAAGSPLFQSLVTSTVLYTARRDNLDVNDTDLQKVAEESYRSNLVSVGASLLYSFFVCFARSMDADGTFNFTRHFMDGHQFWAR